MRRFTLSLFASTVDSSASVFATLRATEFALQGPRELLNQITTATVTTISSKGWSRYQPR